MPEIDILLNTCSSKIYTDIFVLTGSTLISGKKHVQGPTWGKIVDKDKVVALQQEVANRNTAMVDHYVVCCTVSRSTRSRVSCSSTMSG